jgi:signal transduction histidine kinase
LTPEASIAVFRVVQESLTNILKHAKARNVEVSVETEPGWLVVRVCDDGVGLPAHRRHAIGSHGLAAMRHRVVGLGGLWSASERPAGGTQIVARFPTDRIATSAAS